VEQLRAAAVQAATRKMKSVGNTDIFSLIKLLSAESDESLKEFLGRTSRGAIRRRQGGAVQRALHPCQVPRPAPIPEGWRNLFDSPLAESAGGGISTSPGGKTCWRR